jgi:hypothetical protein
MIIAQLPVVTVPPLPGFDISLIKVRSTEDKFLVLPQRKLHIIIFPLKNRLIEITFQVVLTEIICKKLSAVLF